jgi:hypothetical protein
MHSLHPLLQLLVQHIFVCQIVCPLYNTFSVTAPRIFRCVPLEMSVIHASRLFLSSSRVVCEGEKTGHLRGRRHRQDRILQLSISSTPQLPQRKSTHCANGEVSHEVHTPFHFFKFVNVAIHTDRYK